MIPAAAYRAGGAGRSNLTKARRAEEVSWFSSTSHHPKAPLLVGISDSPVSTVCYKDASFRETRNSRVIVFPYGYSFYASWGI